MAIKCSRCGKKEQLLGYVFKRIGDDKYLCAECEEILSKETPVFEKNDATNKERSTDTLSSDPEKNHIIDYLKQIESENREMNASLSSIKGILTFFFAMYIIGIVIIFIVFISR